MNFIWIILKLKKYVYFIQKPTQISRKMKNQNSRK